MKYAKKQIEPGIVVLEMTGRFLMGSDCQAVSGEIDSHILSNEKNFIFDLTTLDQLTILPKAVTRPAFSPRQLS